MKRKFFYASAFLIVLFLVTGCTEWEMVLHKPLLDMAGINKVAVVTFENHSIDPGVSHEISDILADRIKEAKTLEVVTAENMPPASTGAEKEVYKKIGQELGVDAIITGDVTYYADSCTVDPPLKEYESEGRSYWKVNKKYLAKITTTVRLIRVSTGEIIFSRVFSNQQNDSANTYIPWNEASYPPVILIPQPDTQEIPRLRNQAINEVITELAKNFVSFYEYVPKTKSDDKQENVPQQ